MFVRALKATFNDPLLGVMVSIVGAPGTVRGVPVSELESDESPAALLATTVTVYCVPFVSPVMAHVKEVVVHVVVVVPSEADAV